MKTIEEMAHDYMCNLILKGFPLNEVDIMAERCFKLAEAMKAEAEKRKATQNTDPMRNVREAEWQPDWSVAPEWANFWCMQSYSGWCYWTESQPAKKWDQFRLVKCEQAPSFNYQGDWKDSLRKRP